VKDLNESYTHTHTHTLLDNIYTLPYTHTKNHTQKNHSKNANIIRNQKRISLFNRGEVRKK